MRSLLIITLTISSLAGFSQQVTYDVWLKEAKTDSRLLPEYGGSHKTKEQLAADTAYVKTALEEMHATDRRDGAQQLIKTGFNYLAQGDLRAAMYRFNQAWLMDPQYAEVYSGFGSVYFILQDLKASIDLYDKGLTIEADNTNLLSYKARSYLAMYETGTDVRSYYKALPLLRRAYELQPANQYTTYMLSRYYIRGNNCDSAMKYFYECKKAGGEPITEKYENALKTRCGAK